MKIANMHAQPPSSRNSWSLRLLTLLVWLLVGMCAAYWVYKFATTRQVAATAVASVPVVAVDAKVVAKLLGATEEPAGKVAAPVSTTKFSLSGVAASQRGAGYALIAMDGKPAKPYRLGARLNEDYILKKITSDGAVLAVSRTAPDAVTLELAARKPATAVAAAPNMTAYNPIARGISPGADRVPALVEQATNHAAAVGQILPSTPMIPPSSSLTDTAVTGAAAAAIAQINPTAAFQPAVSDGQPLSRPISRFAPKP
jgi:general secretion pathway protein C